MDLKRDSGKSSERNKESWRESLYLLREYINNHEQNVDTHIKVKGHSDELSDGNEDQDIGKERG